MLTGRIADPVSMGSETDAERLDRRPWRRSHVRRTNLLRRQRSDRAFTLIELMVVVLIIGILLAIAIPTFLGARERGQDAVAKASLKTALTAAAVQEYDSDQSRMRAEEPALEYVDGDRSSTGPKIISVGRYDDEWSQAALSDSGTCFYVHLTVDDSVPVWGKSGDAKSCSAEEWVNGSAVPIGGGGSSSGGPTTTTKGGDGGGFGGGGNAKVLSETTLAMAGLVGYWPMDDFVGTVADAGPDHYDGSYSKAAQFAQTGVVKGSSAVRFSGADNKQSWATLPTLPINPGQGITMAAWVNPDRAGFYDRIIELGSGQATDNIWLGRQEARDQVSFGVYANGQSFRLSSGKGTLPTGSWSFVVATQDAGGNALIYINGSPVANGNLPVPDGGSRGTNYVGRSGWRNERPFSGVIDEVSLFDRPLDAGEVATFYKASQ